MYATLFTNLYFFFFFFHFFCVHVSLSGLEKRNEMPNVNSPVNVGVLVESKLYVYFGKCILLSFEKSINPFCRVQLKADEYLVYRKCEN
jgi:hypothetical protein